MGIIRKPDDLDCASEVVRALGAADVPLAVVVIGVPTEAVKGVLGAAEFEESHAMPVMAVDVEEIRETSLPEEYRFSQVTSGAEGQLWIETAAEGFGIPFNLAKYFSPDSTSKVEHDDYQILYFSVYKDEKVVATSAMILADGLAGIYCVTTLPEHRNNGLGAHITAEPLRIAKTMGYGVGTLQSSQAGYSVYSKLGFVDVGSIPMFVRIPE